MTQSDLNIRAVSGDELNQLIPVLADLRIRVFADYPYLYVGSIDYETTYLGDFARAPDAVVVVATDPQGRVAGCATGSALSGHHREFSAPLAAAGYDLASTFYFGESVLDADWRGRGVGHGFFDAREAHARARGYTRACFCAVVRGKDDPREPAGYSALDAFWHKRGYRRIDGLLTTYNWPEVAGGPSIAHPMAYWIRELG